MRRTRQEMLRKGTRLEFHGVDSWHDGRQKHERLRSLLVADVLRDKAQVPFGEGFAAPSSPMLRQEHQIRKQLILRELSLDQ